MKLLADGADVEGFFRRLAATDRRALLLDYDGTLAPFRVQRDRAAPYPGVRQALDTLLAAGHTRLVVISGRSAGDLPPLLGLARGIEVWGTHGWERLAADGTYARPDLDARRAAGLAEALAWAELRAPAGHVEQKPACVALHWRGMPPDSIAALRAETLAHWSPLARDAGLAVHPFDGGIELRVPGRDKGFAVRSILEELGDGAAVACLGDDLTDEDAFTALKGRGLGVLVRAAPRPTAADVWVQPPGELLAFLWRWHWACVGTLAR
jgi:trehalose-phosphatase